MKKLKPRTFLEHREVRGVDREQVQVGRELWHELHQGVEDDLVRAVVPTRELAPLRRSQEKLQNKQIWLKT